MRLIDLERALRTARYSGMTNATQVKVWIIGAGDSEIYPITDVTSDQDGIQIHVNWDEYDGAER